MAISMRNGTDTFRLHGQVSTGSEPGLMERRDRLVCLLRGVLAVPIAVTGVRLHPARVTESVEGK